jgi:hypothetical protein
MRKRSFIRLNMAILSKISSLILSADALRKNLPVQLTPGWHIQNNRIRYLRRVESLDEGNEQTSRVMNVIHENVFYLPVGQLLTTLLTLLGNGRKALYREVITQLCNRPEYVGGEEQIDTYLQHLLRLGLLILPDLQLDIHSENPIASYRQGLLALDISTTNRVAAYLSEIESLVDAYSTASLAGATLLCRVRTGAGIPAQHHRL